jgi:hypothetical protein
LPKAPTPSVECRDAAAIQAEPSDPTKPFVWLGTTDDSGAFREITPNQSLPVVHGVQGGTHVWGAARLYTLDGGNWTLRFALTDAAGAELGRSKQVVEACAGEVIEMTNVPVFLGVSTPTEGLLSVAAVPDPSADGSVSASAAVPIKVL